MDDWRRAEELFHAAMEKTPAARAAFLDQACTGDSELRREVEQLLSSYDTATFFEKPIIAGDTETIVGQASWVGREFGSYRIVSLLGAGGMGEVYLARDRKLGRSVAVKTLPYAFARDAERLARFRREARTLALLNHPNIAAIYGLEQCLGVDCLVLELVDGESPRGPLPLSKALDCTRQVADALDAAHLKGIIHRDLKPANIKLTPEGRIKVLDFGLAKAILEPESGNSQVQQPSCEMTQAGQVVGTPAYMSPEQVRGAELDPRTDIWSLGCVLFEWLSGKQAFSGDTIAEIIAAVLTRDPDWHALPATVPRSIRELLQRCLDKSPDQRPAAAAELRGIIHELNRTTASAAHLPLELPSSIAVLPFANLSSDKENDYFTDGLTEEITNALAHVPGLKVAGRTSSFFFRGKDIHLSEIGRRLNVGHILEGSVRKAGNRIRVTAQLIKVDDGFQLWSERFEREMTDIFAIQDEITQGITDVLRIKLAPPSEIRRHEPNLRAYEAYLAARALWFKATPASEARFREYVDQAIALDPAFDLPHMLLGGYYSMLAHLGIRAAREVIPLARAAEEEALRLNPALADANALLAVWDGTVDYDWPLAERRWRLALAREPGSRDILFWYGNHYLLPIGRISEALDALTGGLEGDPLNLYYRHHLARGLRHAGKLHHAEAELRKVLEVDQDFPAALETLGAICAQQGRFAEGLTLTERAHALIPQARVTAGQFAGLLVRAGESGRAEEILAGLRSGREYGAPTGMTLFHAVLGEHDRALEWADRALDERYPEFIKIVRPWLKQTTGWKRLAKKMNLPDTISE